MEFAEAENIPVSVPDDPYGVVQSDSPASIMLKTSGLVIVRQLEMMSMFLARSLFCTRLIGKGRFVPGV